MDNVFNLHLLGVLMGAGALSLPFMVYSMFQCGALNPNATAPFTHYQGITSGLNLVVVGAYLWMLKYALLGQVVLGLGVIGVGLGYLGLSKWYRCNPRYIWRLFGNFSKETCHSVDSTP